MILIGLNAVVAICIAAACGAIAAGLIVYLANKNNPNTKTNVAIQSDPYNLALHLAHISRDTHTQPRPPVLQATVIQHTLLKLQTKYPPPASPTPTPPLPPSHRPAPAATHAPHTQAHT